MGTSTLTTGAEQDVDRVDRVGDRPARLAGESGAEQRVDDRTPPHASAAAP